MELCHIAALLVLIGLPLIAYRNACALNKWHRQIEKPKAHHLSGWLNRWL